MNNLDAILENFIALANSHGIRKEELMDGWTADFDAAKWNLNYKRSLDANIKKYAQNLLSAVDLSRAAMAREDKLTVTAALIYAKIFSTQLADAFSEVSAEFQRVLHEDSRFKWPIIPDDFKIPESYNYQGPL